MFSCYGNKKTYATVTGAALTTALLASFHLDLSFVSLCECFYFYSQGIPSRKSKGHYRSDTPNFLCCKTWLQIPCTSEIPRIFGVLSLSFLTVLYSEVYKILQSGQLIPQKPQSISAQGLFCDFLVVCLGLSLLVSGWSDR